MACCLDSSIAFTSFVRLVLVKGGQYQQGTLSSRRIDGDSPDGDSPLYTTRTSPLYTRPLLLALGIAEATRLLSELLGH